MARTSIRATLPRLRHTLFPAESAARSDADLLESFLRHRDEAAFEALVRRHGPLVLGVCRRVARDHHDAEDAFQATFLILARKADSVRPREKLANWLYGVAFRTAAKARAMAARRRVREESLGDVPERERPHSAERNDLRALIDRELNGLPDIYRLPILLCDLGGQSIQDAMRQLAWPQGTVAGRLARGRKLLARRLANRGVVAPAGLVPVALVPATLLARVSSSLVLSTTRVALLGAASPGATAGISPTVSFLSERVMMTALWQRIRATGAVVALGLAGLAGSVLLPTRSAVAEPPRPKAAAVPDPGPAVGETKGHATLMMNVKVVAVPEGTPFGTKAAKGDQPSTLTDVQLAAALEALQSNREAQILSCPTVTTFDDEKAVVQVGDRRELVTGVRAERRKSETVLAPVTTPVETGLTLTLRGHASQDRRFVKVNADYTDRRLERIEVVPLAPPPGQTVAPVPYLQTPHVETTRIASGALDIPVDGHVLLRGPTYVQRGEAQTVVPLLAELPYIGCLFKGTRPTRTTKRVYLVVSAKVID